jgi:hypothetical protein
VPDLIKILHGKHQWSRQRTAVALGQIHRRREIAVPALLQYLGHAAARRNGVSQAEAKYAIRSLGQFGPDAAIALPAIRQHVNSPWSGFQRTVDDPKNDLGDVAQEAIRRITQKSNTDQRSKDEAQQPPERDK